jgi:hypothetical protein
MMSWFWKLVGGRGKRNSGFGGDKVSFRIIWKHAIKAATIRAA